MTEAQLQRAIIDLAMRLGWMVNHQRPAMALRTDGTARWMTATQGHTGFPDLVLAHERHGVVFAELKSERGSLDQAQKKWRDTIMASGQAWHLWKPRDWHTGVVENVLGYERWEPR